MKTVQLIKDEGVEIMRREELEAKLGRGEQLTMEEANQLSFFLRKEEFLVESKKALTSDELELIKDITGIERLTENTTMDLLLTLQEHILGDKVNPDFTEELSIVIAKVQKIYIDCQSALRLRLRQLSLTNN